MTNDSWSPVREYWQINMDDDTYFQVFPSQVELLDKALHHEKMMQTVRLTDIFGRQVWIVLSKITSFIECSELSRNRIAMATHDRNDEEKEFYARNPELAPKSFDE